MHAVLARRWPFSSTGKVGLAIVLSLAMCALGGVASARAAGLSVVGLAADGATDNASTGSLPLGIDDSTPRLTWQIQDGSARGVMQTSYEVLVATTAAKAVPGQADVWDSGVQQSSNLYANYAGPALSSMTRYYWSVGVSVNGSPPTAWSTPAWLQTAFLFPSGTTEFNALGIGQPSTNCTVSTCYQCVSGQVCGAPGWQASGAQWIQGPPRVINLANAGLLTAAQEDADDACCVQAGAPTSSSPNSGTPPGGGPISLSTAQSVGATTLYVNNIEALTPGLTITINTGATNQETQTVTSVGTVAPANTSLAEPSFVGDTNVSVASVTNYAVGAPITIDASGTSPEHGTITAVGTAAGASQSLLLPTAVGATTLYVSSTSGITAGQQVGVDGATNYQRATVQTVGTAGVSTKLFSATTTAPPTTTIYLNSVSGLAAGNVLLIDTGASQESATIKTVGTAATTATFSAATSAGATSFTTTSSNSFAAGDTVTINPGASQVTDTIASVTSARVGSTTTYTVTLNTALVSAYPSGTSVTDTGSGVVLTAALTNAHAAGATVIYSGTGVTLTGGLSLAHAGGATVRGLGTGITFTPALTVAHAAAAVVSSLGTGIGITPGLTLSHAAGEPILGPVPSDYCRNKVGGQPANICQAVRPAPMFRKQFTLNEPPSNVTGAYLYAAGVAYNNMTIDGTPTSGNPTTGIGERFLDPGWTNYNDTVQYTTQDVTGLLQSGSTHVIATQLGSGQFDEAGTSGDWHWEEAEWRNTPELIADLVVHYADGTTQSIPTNNSWTVSIAGPNRFDNYYDGETFDARKSIPGWSTASFNSSSPGWSTFQPANVVAGPLGVLRSQQNPPTVLQNVYPASTFVTSGGPLGTTSAGGGISGIGLSQGLQNNATAQTVATTLPNGQTSYSPFFMPWNSTGTAPVQGIEIYDTGQDRAGWATLSVYNCPAGTPIQVLYGEKWNTGALTASPPPGTINNSGFTEAGQLQTDVYVCNGTGTAANPEVWSPQFSIKGFQFIQVSSPSNPASQAGGTPQPLPAGVNATITQMDQVGMANEQIGTFTSSSPELNLISSAVQNTVHNCQWSGTMCDTPIYEKDPWTGDAELSAQTESDYYNTNLEYSNDEQDMEDNAVKTNGIPNAADTVGEVTLLTPTDQYYGHINQTFKTGANQGATPIWDAFWFVQPWEEYEQYGDIRGLQEVYPLMKNYLLDWVPKFTGTSTQGDNDGLPFTLSSGLGDWDPATGANGNAAMGTNFSAPTVIESSSTAFYGYMAEIAQQAANVLAANSSGATAAGYSADASTFAGVVSGVASSYNQAFWDPTDQFYREGGHPFAGPNAGVANSNYQSNTALSQTDQDLALAFNLVPGNEITPVEQKLINDVVNTRSCHGEYGIAGNEWLLPVLSGAADQGVAGAADAALCVAQQTTYPSYGFEVDPVSQGGMGWTTIGEYWEASARSRDHHMFATIGQWFFQNLAGIQAGAPGYSTVNFMPTVPDGLNSVSATINTDRGPVSSAWHTVPASDPTVEYDFTVPPDTTANVYIPGWGGSSPTDPTQVREVGSGENWCAQNAPGVSYVGVVGDSVEYSVGSGSYSFLAPAPGTAPAGVPPCGQTLAYPSPTTAPTASVQSTLSLSLASSVPSFGTFTPGVQQGYTTSTTATATSTAASASLSAVDQSSVFTGHLVNNAVGGPYQLASPLQVNAADGGNGASTGYQALSSSPTTAVVLLNYANPVSNDPITIGFLQPIGASDPLRTGSYTKTITFTLSTNTP